MRPVPSFLISMLRFGGDSPGISFPSFSARRKMGNTHGRPPAGPAAVLCARTCRKNGLIYRPLFSEPRSSRSRKRGPKGFRNALLDLYGNRGPPEIRGLEAGPGLFWEKPAEARMPIERIRKPERIGQGSIYGHPRIPSQKPYRRDLHEKAVYE